MATDGREVVQVYAAYLEDVNQLRATRTAIDNTFVTVVTLLLGGAGYLASTFLLPPQVMSLGSARPETWAGCLGVVAIAYIGIRFCRLWHSISEDNRKSIAVKFKNLENMERESTVLKETRAHLFINEYEDRHPELKNAPASPTSNTTPHSNANGETGASARETVKASRHKVSRQSTRGVSSGVRNLQKLFEEIFRLLLWATPVLKGVAVIAVSLVIPMWPHLPSLPPLPGLY